MIRTFHNNRGPSTACTAAFQDATHDDENTSSAALFPHPLHSRWAVTADLGLSGVASYPVVAGRTGSHGVSDLFLSLVYCFFQSLFCVRDAICALAFSAIERDGFCTCFKKQRISRQHRWLRRSLGYPGIRHLSLLTTFSHTALDLSIVNMYNIPLTLKLSLPKSCLQCLPYLHQVTGAIIHARCTIRIVVTVL
jgi:hypothetical protein